MCHVKNGNNSNRIVNDLLENSYETPVTPSFSTHPQSLSLSAGSLHSTLSVIIYGKDITLRVPVEISWGEFEKRLKKYLSFQVQDILMFQPVTNTNTTTWKAIYGEDDWQSLLHKYRHCGVVIRKAAESEWEESEEVC